MFVTIYLINPRRYMMWYKPYKESKYILPIIALYTSNSRIILPLGKAVNVRRHITRTTHQLVGLEPNVIRQTKSSSPIQGLSPDGLENYMLMPALKTLKRSCIRIKMCINVWMCIVVYVNV